MDRIKRVIAWGGEPYSQPVMKLNALEKKPMVRFDWTHQRLKDVSRWVNRWLWKYTAFEGYAGSVKSSRMQQACPDQMELMT